LAIFGAGGVGGYFGALLAKSGEEVSFIARGEHLKAIRGRGLSVRSVNGDFSVRVKATSDPREIGPVDLVLFCVKTYDSGRALGLLPHLVGDETSVLSLQNGVDNHEKIGAVVGLGKVIGGLAHIESFVESPSVIRQSSKIRRITIGELDGRLSARVRNIENLFKRAGIDCVVSSNIISDVWQKFMFICAMGGVCSVARATIGHVLAFEGTRALYLGVLKEVRAVAEAKGVSLPTDVVERTVAFTEGLHKGMKPSMLHDLERGKRIEVDALTGTVVRVGKECGIPTPVNEFIYSCLKLQDDLRTGSVGIEP